MHHPLNLCIACLQVLFHKCEKFGDEKHRGVEFRALGKYTRLSCKWRAPQWVSQQEPFPMQPPSSLSTVFPNQCSTGVKSLEIKNLMVWSTGPLEVLLQLEGSIMGTLKGTSPHAPSHKCLYSLSLILHKGEEFGDQNHHGVEYRALGSPARFSFKILAGGGLHNGYHDVRNKIDFSNHNYQSSASVGVPQKSGTSV
jgi:hypothetical protein